MQRLHQSPKRQKIHHDNDHDDHLAPVTQTKPNQIKTFQATPNASNASKWATWRRPWCCCVCGGGGGVCGGGGVGGGGGPEKALKRHTGEPSDGLSE